MTKKMSGWLGSLALIGGLAAVPGAQAADAVKQVRLYALDCGRVDVSDMRAFDDAGALDGKAASLVAPCFLIRHPKGSLIWDAGLGDGLAAKKEGVTNGVFHLSVPKTMADQLKQIDVAPADVNFIAFSHLHFDHTGNANAFTGATWIMNKAELAWAEATPTPFAVDPSTFSAYKTAKQQLIDGDYDVFGDGSVKIVKTPGHTPGHGVLELKLAKAGTVILSGDLYHTLDNRKLKRVPAFNDSRANTLASIDRTEHLVANRKARFIVQHDPKSVASLPKFPAYLD